MQRLDDISADTVASMITSGHFDKVRDRLFGDVYVIHKTGVYHGAQPRVVSIFNAQDKKEICEKLSHEGWEVEDQYYNAFAAPGIIRPGTSEETVGAVYNIFMNDMSGCGFHMTTMREFLNGTFTHSWHEPAWSL